MVEDSRRHPLYYAGFLIWIACFGILALSRQNLFASKPLLVLTLALYVIAVYLVWKFGPSEPEKKDQARSWAVPAAALSLVLSVLIALMALAAINRLGPG